MAYFGCHVLVLLQNLLTIHDYAEIADTVYQAYLEAGAPYSMTEMGGYSLIVGIGGAVTRHIWRGRLCDVGEDSVQGGIDCLEAARVGFLAATLEFTEAAWEPLCSPRVKRGYAQRVKAGAPKSPVSCTCPPPPPHPPSP